MPNTAEKTIQDWSAGLPPKLRDAVLTVSMAGIIYDIGRQYGLSIDKIGGLAEEVVRFVSGEIRSKEFISSLLQILETDREKTAAIAAEVNNKIFAAIRDALKKTTIPPPTQKVALPSAALATSIKPVSPPPKPPSQPKLMPQDVVAAPRKPEPLIIRPMPSPAQISPREIWAGKLPAEAIQPKPKTAPPVIPTALTAPKTPASMPPIEIRPMPAVSPKPKPAPVITSLGIQPSAPPQAIYEKAKETVQKELEEFQHKEATTPTPKGRGSDRSVGEAAKEIEMPPPAMAPSPHVITKEELQKEIERFRKNDQGGEGDKSGEIAPKPAPPKLPQEKIPKPPAPDRYTIDPYKEPTE